MHPQWPWRHTTPQLAPLHSLSLFVTLTPGELQLVSGLLHQRRYLAEEIIFDEGEEGAAIYIVLSGLVQVARQGSDSAQLLAELAPGDFFGDLALLDNAPRTAQARARLDSTVAVFFRTDFLQLLQTHGRIGSKISLQLARHLGQRLRRVIEGGTAAPSL